MDDLTGQAQREQAASCGTSRTRRSPSEVNPCDRVPIYAVGAAPMAPTRFPHLGRDDQGSDRSRRRGPLLPSRKFPHRPLAPGGSGGDYARPFRSCAMGQRRLSLSRGLRADPAQATRRRSHRDAALRRKPRHRRGAALAASRWPCHRLGAGAHRAPGRGLGRLRRLQAGSGWR